MIRLIFLALTGYFGFKLVQKFFINLFAREIPGSSAKPEVASEELVQDPICKIFVPRRNALTYRKNGEDFFFCSEGCRKKFMK